MSHRASSRRARALGDVPQRFWREARTTSQYSRSMARGSSPNNTSSKSRTHPTIPYGLRLSLHSPHPTTPSSVSTLTKIQGRHPASHRNACTRLMRMWPILPGSTIQPWAKPVPPQGTPWGRYPDGGIRSCTMAIATRRDLFVEAAPEDVGMSSAGLRNVSRLVQGYLDERKLPGAISLVARRGPVVHFETYRNMDDERQKPTRPDAILPFYSMTKPIASVGLMMLYEQGRFQLDDPASRFIPELKTLKVFVSGTADDFEVREPAREMTVRDLLMHTSGLVGRDTASPVGHLYRRAGFTGADAKFSLAEMVQKLKDIPLEVDPGSRWIYGISTDLVGYLCQVITALPFQRYLDEPILGPLRLVDTGFAVP